VISAVLVLLAPLLAVLARPQRAWLSISPAELRTVIVFSIVGTRKQLCNHIPPMDTFQSLNWFSTSADPADNATAEEVQGAVRG